MSTLTRSGFRVHASGHHEPDVEEIVRLRPALIAVDLDSTDDFDVFAFACQLREDMRTRHVPMVVFSRHLQAQDVERAVRDGVLSIHTGFLPDDSKLIAVIRGVLAGTPPDL
jgi:CheY-like chemotaxis protein